MKCKHYIDIVMTVFIDLQLVSDEEGEPEVSFVTQPTCHEVHAVTSSQQITSCDDHAVELSASCAIDEKSAADVENWLRQNVIIEYWKGECENRPNAACRFSNIAVDWFVFKVSNIIVFLL